jgi:hypothetical protein
MLRWFVYFHDVGLDEYVLSLFMMLIIMLQICVVFQPHFHWKLHFLS